MLMRLTYYALLSDTMPFCAVMCHDVAPADPISCNILRTPLFVAETVLTKQNTSTYRC